MHRHKASRTAQYMAYFRALESARSPQRRLFYDPFAPYFLGAVLRGAARIARLPLAAPLVERYTDLRLPGARTSAIARTKLIDDSLRDALASGITQVVILGAGFDCRAYRLSELHRTVVFEIDHPATLAVKLDCLHQALPKIPDNVRYVEIDFLHQSLPEVLSRARFDPSRAAFFIWEGVTQYLAADAVDSVLAFVAASAPATRLMFTYVHGGMLDGSTGFKAARRLLRGYAGLGEPWIFGLRPDRVGEFLSARGLSFEHDWSADEYRRLSYGSTADQMKGYEFYHTVLATKP
jgi:methyltransferase (TIGR00027 family)